MVDALTRQEGESYDQFLRRASASPGAKLVQEADIRDNYSRLDGISDEVTRNRLRGKYERALALLANL